MNNLWRRHVNGIILMWTKRMQINQVAFYSNLEQENSLRSRASINEIFRCSNTGSFTKIADNFRRRSRASKQAKYQTWQINSLQTVDN